MQLIAEQPVLDQQLNLHLDGDPLVADIYTPADGGDGSPLLLIHGWGGSGRSWQPAIERLRLRYRLVVPDLPGVGRSLPVARGRSMFDQVQALETLIEHLGIGPVRLIGHSMGGGIAILLAAQQPHLVEQLILVGVALFRDESERSFFRMITSISGMMMRVRPEILADLPLFTRQFAARFFYRVPNDPVLLREGMLDYLRMDYATALISARSATHPGITWAATQVRCPTLLIVSRQDRVMPVSNVAYTAETIPGCQVEWIEECGHLPMVEQPDRFVDIVQRFLSAPLVR
ncbi:MAG: alpha/beta hydrolase [Roseiflexaceae bacterium]